MASMGTYLVLAYFAGQTTAWFKQSNLIGASVVSKAAN